MLHWPNHYLPPILLITDFCQNLRLKLLKVSGFSTSDAQELLKLIQAKKYLQEHKNGDYSTSEKILRKECHTKVCTAVGHQKWWPTILGQKFHFQTLSAQPSLCTGNFFTRLFLKIHDSNQYTVI